LLQKDKDMLGTLNKTIDLLETFNSNDLFQSIEKMSETTGYPKTTVFRIVQTLVARGWMVQDKKTKKYGMSFGLLRYGKLVTTGNNLITICDPIMKKIRDALNETVVLSVHGGSDYSICIHVLNNNQFIRFAHEIGAKIPLFAGTVGRCILAFGPESFLYDYIERVELKRLAKNTILDKKQLLQEVKTTREKGYGISLSEVNDNTMSICVPLFDKSGNFLACMNVASLEEKDSPQYRSTVLRLLNEAAEEIRAL